MIYKAFASSIKGENDTRLSFVKESNHTLPRVTTSEKEMQSNEELSRPRSLRILPNISDSSAVFMPGPSASFILKTAKSCPHVLRLRGESVRDLSIFDLASPSLDKGFVYVDSKVFPLPHLHVAHAESIPRTCFASVGSHQRPYSIIHGP